MQGAQGVVQHWLLNTAIESPRTLSDLFPVVRGLHLNVLDVPGATQEDYASGVLALFDSGSIRMYFDGDEEGSEIEACHSIVESILQRRLAAPAETTPNPHANRKTIHPRRVTPDTSDLRWQLTAVGGEAWERLAQPDWNRYFTILTGGEQLGEAWSANFDLLMAVLGWCRELNGVEIDRTTINLEVLHDSPITYWKLLPVVHRASFESKWVESCWVYDRHDHPEWFHQWWISQGEWYKKPWKLPIWPNAS
jgi:hypothetical protein